MQKVNLTEKLAQFYQQLFARLDALPGVHSAVLSESVPDELFAPHHALASIRCLSLYDDINNSRHYKPVQTLRHARDSLKAFKKLQSLAISESEGVNNLDRLTVMSSSHRSITPRLLCLCCRRPRL
jgi:hypothetical protein